MRESLAIGVALVTLINVISVSAQTRTLTPSPTDKVKAASPSASLSPTTVEDKEVKALKERVANKVKELTKDTKAVAGFVQETKDSQITIKTADDKVSVVKIDTDLTKYYQITGTTRKEIKLTTIKKGDYAIISGPAIGETITANVIYIDERLEVRSGKVTEVSTDDSTIKVVTTEKDSITITITRSTKLLQMDIKTLDTSSTKLSKVKEGDTIHFVYSVDPTAKDPAKVTALKVLVIPQEFFQK